MPIPQEIRDAASEAEAVSEDVFDSAAPPINATKDEMNVLIKTLNKLLPLFEQEPLPLATQDHDGEPVDSTVMRFLTMVLSAAEGAGIEGVSLADVDTLIDGRSLELLAGQLELLSKSQPFKTWLKTQDPKAPADKEPKPGMGMDKDMGPGPGMTDEADDMDLFSSRMQ